MFHHIHLLIFKAFLENPKNPGKFTVILAPVCSKPIYNPFMWVVGGK